MRVFITGITGTLGTALANLHHSGGDRVWGCARNESKAWEWSRVNPRDITLFVADAFSLTNPHSDCGRLLHSMDRVYHCAAMKHVDVCEKQPPEACWENVELTDNVSSVCEGAKVPLVFISSDKACLPQGVYGATKLIAERCVLQRGGAVVRLGNLIGSSGSVFKVWKDAVEKGEPIKLTDPDMTRYFIPVEDAARFVADNFVAGVVSIPDPMKAARMGDVARRLLDVCDNWKKNQTEVIGRREGETLHQWLVAPGERATRDAGAVMLTGDGETYWHGMTSESAPMWDVDQLLKVAGVI